MGLGFLLGYFLLKIWNFWPGKNEVFPKTASLDQEILIHIVRILTETKKILINKTRNDSLKVSSNLALCLIPLKIQRYPFGNYVALIATHLNLSLIT